MSSSNGPVRPLLPVEPGTMCRALLCAVLAAALAACFDGIGVIVVDGEGDGGVDLPELPGSHPGHHPTGEDDEGTGPEADPDPDPEPESDPGSDSDSDSDTDRDPGSDADSDSDADPDPGSDADSDSDPDPSEPDAGSDTGGHQH